MNARSRGLRLSDASAFARLACGFLDFTRPTFVCSCDPENGLAKIGPLNRSQASARLCCLRPIFGGKFAQYRMQSIARALEGLKVRSAVIDGEAVVVGEDGLSDFFSLHAALARKDAPRAVLVAFDLMHLDGEGLRTAAPSSLMW